MWRWLQYSRKAPLNSVPWSTLMPHGTPNLHTIYVCSHSIVEWLDLSTRGAASTHFENGQTAVMQTDSPRGPSGSSFVTRSMHHSAKGRRPFQVALIWGGALNRAASI